MEISPVILALHVPQKRPSTQRLATIIRDGVPTIEIGDPLIDRVPTHPSYPPIAGRRSKMISCARCSLRFRAYVAKYHAGPRLCAACAGSTPPATEARCA